MQKIVLNLMLILITITTIGCSNSNSADSKTGIGSDSAESEKRDNTTNQNSRAYLLRTSHKDQHPRFRALAQSRNRELDAGFSELALTNCPPIDPTKINRFIKGKDNCAFVMPASEITSQLNDPFGVSVLRKGDFKFSVEGLLGAISKANPNLSRNSFLVAEGGQIPSSVTPRTSPRNPRLVVVWGAEPPQILLSAAPGGNSGFLQVMSWDSQNNKFNFYDVMPQIGKDANDVTIAWAWKGDSTMARQPDTIGQGCFDCHHNGVPIMKELKFPWNNWNSERVAIAPEVLPQDVANDPLVSSMAGAQALESVIQSGFQNYYNSFMADNVKRVSNSNSDFNVTNVDQMLAHITSNTTINFASSAQTSDVKNSSLPNKDVRGIPNDFFLWDSVLATLLRIDYKIPDISLARAQYDGFLKEHSYELIQKDGSPNYQQGGSTFFSFFVPVPAAEDNYMATQLHNYRGLQLVPAKFIAAVASVDFSKPVFSSKRNKLKIYSDQLKEGTIRDGISSIPEDFAKIVRPVAARQPACDPAKVDACTAEQQFLAVWDMPEKLWKEALKTRIQAHLDQLAAMPAQQQLDFLMSKAIERHKQFASYPIIKNLNEFSLLLPHIKGQ
ncbi:MAG: hypothetical protein ACI9SP_002905 [Arenicella sp.]|jgi:hypothetical protein